MIKITIMTTMEIIRPLFDIIFNRRLLKVKARTDEEANLILVITRALINSSFNKLEEDINEFYEEQLTSTIRLKVAELVKDKSRDNVWLSEEEKHICMQNVYNVLCVTSKDITKHLSKWQNYYTDDDDTPVNSDNKNDLLYTDRIGMLTTTKVITIANIRYHLKGNTVTFVMPNVKIPYSTFNNLITTENSVHACRLAPLQKMC